LFPGQGAQQLGMLHELIDDPAVELTLDGQCSHSISPDFITVFALSRRD
jgi:malonyl CoA-acyl carrier protein transacylase